MQLIFAALLCLATVSGAYDEPRQDAVVCVNSQIDAWLGINGTVPSDLKEGVATANVFYSATLPSDNHLWASIANGYTGTEQMRYNLVLHTLLGTDCMMFIRNGCSE